MSLTYSASQPGSAMPRATVVTLIVFVHAAMFIALNSGLGSLFVTKPPERVTLIDVPPEKRIVDPVPVPEQPKVDTTFAFDNPLKNDKPTINIAPDINDKPSIIDGPPNIEVQKDDPVTQTRSRAEIAYRVDPLYPANSQRSGEQGTVVLAVRVDVTGNVINVNVLQSSGFDALDAAAIKAVKHWRFKPGSMSADIRVPIKFELNSQRY